jgi:hypothetical protein
VATSGKLVVGLLLCFLSRSEVIDPEFKARSLQHSSQGTAPDSVVDGNLLNLYMKYHMHADLLRHCSLCATLDATAQWLSF